MPEFQLGRRMVGDLHPPLVIAEIGINHEGSLEKARQMVDDAERAGCECVKFQCHVLADEMVPNDVIPGNASESIWNIVSRCSLSEADELKIKAYVESKGMIFLSTPFSREAANRLYRMGVCAFKIGSGECNNYPLIDHIARFRRPVLLSTGMNDLASIGQAVSILRGAGLPYALLHCTSLYPTPVQKVRLGALLELKREFSDAVIGLSDHSTTIFPCLGAVALGASIVERHFTSTRDWPGPDVPISMVPEELKALIEGSRVIFDAGGGTKEILKEEQATINFAYASVVTLRNIKTGEKFSADNLWVKRPGTGEIRPAGYDKILGKIAARDIAKNQQLSWRDICEAKSRSVFDRQPG